MPRTEVTLSTAEAAEIKGVSRQSVVNAIQSGALRADVIPNGARVVHRNDVKSRWGSRIAPGDSLPEYLTVSDISHFTGIAKQVAHRAVRSGRVPSVDKPDTETDAIVYRIRKSDLEKWTPSK